MRPSNKTWSLTVRAGGLYFDALRVPMVPEVEPVVKALPDGTGVECDGAFDGGGTILNLVVTRVTRILVDLSGRVMTLPDAVVASDARLAAARARIHVDAGRFADAARDVGALLALGDDNAIADFERLPGEQQEALLDALVDWQAARPAAWRALRYLPLARWSDANVDEALAQALASGGVFGTAPGVRAEALLEELERRKKPTQTLAKQTQKLRRAQATEGDTVYRLATELEMPRVIGADHAGVFVAGRERDRAVVVQYALDGVELRRWIDIEADRIVEGVALRIDHPEPAGIRLSDGKTLYTFAHRIEHHDGELVWGVDARDPVQRTMRSAIVHIATGWTIAELDGWVDDVVWDAQHIFVYGDRPQTLTRDGRVVRADVPPRTHEITIEAASGARRIPSAHAPWRFGSWDTVDAGGWIVHTQGRRIYLAASEPDATWTHVELATKPARVDLAPPWLAIHVDSGGPIVLVALAEAISALEVRIDGKRFVRRARTEPGLAVPVEIVTWYGALVDAGVVLPCPDAERDAHLHRTLGGRLADDALARVLIGRSPYCIVHADHFVDEADDLFAQLALALADCDVSVRELERHDDGMLTLEASREGRALPRRCGATIVAVMATVDAMLAQLGSPRRIFSLVYDDPHKRAYLVITPEQRRSLVAAGVQGIHASAR